MKRKSKVTRRLACKQFFDITHGVSPFFCGVGQVVRATEFEPWLFVKDVARELSSLLDYSESATATPTLTKYYARELFIKHYPMTTIRCEAFAPAFRTLHFDFRKLVRLFGTRILCWRR